MRPLTLSAAFQGLSHLDGTNGLPNVQNEHQAEMFINQSYVLSTAWDSQSPRFATDSSGNIPQSVLHSGVNSLQIYNANPGNIAIAEYAFNWAEIRYQRLYIAEGDYLDFTVPDDARPGYYNFLIRNFRNSSICVYRMNNSKITDVSIKPIDERGNSRTYSASFQVLCTIDKRPLCRGKRRRKVPPCPDRKREKCQAVFTGLFSGLRHHYQPKTLRFDAGTAGSLKPHK